MFFDAASEEREHAMKLIEYLLMRGELTTDVTTLLQVRVSRHDKLDLEHVIDRHLTAISPRALVCCCSGVRVVDHLIHNG